MIDQQQPAPSYPGFEMTSAGLEAVYSTLGRVIHEALEANLKANKATTLLQQVKAQMAPPPETQTADEPPAGG